MSSNIIGYCLTSMNSNHRNNLFKTLTDQEKDSLKKKNQFWPWKKLDVSQMSNFSHIRKCELTFLRWGQFRTKQKHLQ